jgi:colicin import membrane protein
VTNQRNQERRRVESQRREREKAAALKAQQEQREEAARQKRRAEAEAQRQRQVERERQQKAETEAAAKRERELREQREREAEQRRAREAAQQEQRRRDAEAAEAAAAEAASSEFELVQSATGLIQQLVTENWSRPPSARNGMRVVIQIRMLPTGELIDARITQSSGDPAFDRSAENAVYRAAPFSELTALPIRVFNQNFRTLSLIFQPEDLLN